MTAWAELARVPVLGNVIDIRQEGRARSALTNVPGPPLAWRATFDGAWPTLAVDGQQVKTSQGTDGAGRPASWVVVTVPPGKSMSVFVRATPLR